MYFPHHFRRVAFRIDGDEDRLQFCEVGAEFLDHRGDFVQCRRADVGTGSIAKENQQPFAVISLHPVTAVPSPAPLSVSGPPTVTGAVSTCTSWLADRRGPLRYVMEKRIGGP